MTTSKADLRRDGRNEWIADALNERDDRAEWEAQRNADLGLDVGWVSTAEMVASLAAERAEVEAGYDPRDFGWWNSPERDDS